VQVVFFFDEKNRWKKSLEKIAGKNRWKNYHIRRFDNFS